MIQQQEDLYKPNCIRLYSGKYFDFTNITPDSFDMEDLAWGMSGEFRWANQSRIPITVGQHTIFCYQMYPSFKTLIHDSPEGILGDWPTAMKALMPQYQIMEKVLYAAICKKFGVDPAPDPQVKYVDKISLEHEWQYYNLGAYHAPALTMSRHEVFDTLKNLFKKHIEVQKLHLCN